MSATIKLIRQDLTEISEVPLSALHYGDDGASVWTVSAEGRIEHRPVTVAGLGFETARIASGISEGERVVVIGGHKLTPGEVVRIVEDGG